MMPVSPPRCWRSAPMMRLGRGVEQDVVDDRLVRECDSGDGGRHGEDDVEIGDRQKVSLTVCEPLSARQALTLRAVSIATTIVSDANYAALVTTFNVAAERCG